MAELFGIAACLVANAWLAAAEMAFVTVRRAQLRKEARGGRAAARRLLALRERPERTLSVIQVGITSVGALAAAVGGAGAQQSIQPRLREALGWGATASEAASIVLVVVPLTFVSVVLGELVPKSLALRDPFRISLRSARALAALDRVLAPVVVLLEGSTQAVIGLLSRSEPSRDKGKGAVDLDELSQQTREYVLNLVELEERRIRDVYVPWARVVSVRAQEPVDAVERAIVASGHTRLPVVDGDAVVGLLNTKEFMALRASGRDAWSEVVRPIIQVAADEPLLRTLRRLQLNQSHLGVVLSGDEKLGIVTIEDILEEVIGEVYDEDDDGALRRVLSSSPTFRSIRSRRRP